MTSRWTRRRRIVQVSVLAAYLAIPWLIAAGWRGIVGTLAAVQMGPLSLVEPAAALFGLVAALGKNVPLVLLAGAALPLAAALALGPVYCSWVCPWGLISEQLDRWRVRGRRRIWPDRAWVAVRRPRLVTLAMLLVLTAVLGVPLGAILSPPRVVSLVPYEVVVAGSISAASLAVMLLVLAAEWWLPRRWWCRVLCPVGAVHNLLRLPWTLTMRFDEARCSCPQVALCHARCAWGIDPRAMRRYDGCTTCLACIETCPTGALRVGAGPARPKEQS